jgi:2-isopropylmalate synthase
VAYLELRVGDVTRHGVGIDGSIVRASMQAILSGLSRAAVTVPHIREENVR